MPHDFHGKTAFVTGAGSGIGAAAATVLALSGASVVLLDQNKEGLDAVAAAIAADGGAALPVVGDVSRPEDVEQAVRRTVDEFGALHYAVNNAGITGRFVPTHELTVEEWAEVIDVNLNGVFYSTKYEIPAMLASGGGAIVNISSVFGDRGGPNADYPAAKHALRGLTRSLAIGYAEQGIRVNELQPGVIDTGMTRANPEGTKAVAERGVPMRRVGNASEVATAIAFLLSDDASYITGAHLAVDGGFLA